MSFFTGILILLVLLEILIPNEYLNSILQVDAFFGIVPMTLVEPAVFAFVCLGLRQCLTGKVYPYLLELHNGAFCQNPLTRSIEGT